MKTSKSQTNSSSLNEIVFTKRNKMYGAYCLRKRYPKVLIISFLLSAFFVSSFAGYSLYRGYKLAHVKHQRIIHCCFNGCLGIVPDNTWNYEIISHDKFTRENKVSNSNTLNKKNNYIKKRKTATLQTNSLTKKHTDTTAFVHATFQGGDSNKFKSWIQNNLEYPCFFPSDSTSISILANFDVDRLGNIKNISINSNNHLEFAKEVVKAIIKSPKDWKPARKNGKKVSESFAMTIVIKLD